MQLHTFRRFDEELVQVRDMILIMGGLIEKAIDRSVSAFINIEPSIASQIIEDDKIVNAMEVQIDEMLRKIMARRQPAGRDLRFLIAVMKVVTDLERIGDLAVSIAKGVLDTERKPGGFSNIELMSVRVQKQVNNALDAFSRENDQLAMQVIEKDSEINALYHDIYRETVAHMLEEPGDIGDMILLTNIIKNLERVGDHATNIAEMVIYIAKGHDIRHVDHKSATALLENEKAA